MIRANQQRKPLMELQNFDFGTTVLQEKFEGQGTKLKSPSNGALTSFLTQETPPEAHIGDMLSK
jgi:hypothetical protein